MINKPDLAVEVRDELKNFYSVIKDSDEYLKFVFLTGVTKFSKVSLFSGLNNLEDITLHKDYGDICGYTQYDLETVFAERLENLDLEKLKKWYNGYNFLGNSVYNPFDILLFFSNHNTYKTYWFQTATPTFLIKLMQKNKYFIPQLENLEVSEEIIGSFDVDKINIETLLFQTGYLTIDKTYQVFNKLKFKLKYPNFEVKTSLNTYIFDYLAEPENSRHEDEFYQIMLNNDVKKIEKNIFSLFSSIPSDNYQPTPQSRSISASYPSQEGNVKYIANYEGYYASVIYAYFAGMGVDFVVEDSTNKGYIDMTLFFENRAYIIEFKVSTNKPKTNTALKQIKEKKYYEKYIYKYDKVYNIGIVFGKRKKNIVRFNYETVKSIKNTK